MKEFLNKEQRQMQLFPEASATSSRAHSQQTLENALPQYSNVFSLFERKKSEECDAERIVTKKILDLLNF